MTCGKRESKIGTAWPCLQEESKIIEHLEKKQKAVFKGPNSRKDGEMLVKEHFQL